MVLIHKVAFAALDVTPLKAVEVCDELMNEELPEGWGLDDIDYRSPNLTYFVFRSDDPIAPGAV